MRASRDVGPLFAGVIGLGAFLLFLVQFIMGKQILPWFGGAPAVWTTCMLFFQVGLLAGYAYAHLLCRMLPPPRQRDVHIALLAAALGLLATRGFAWPSPINPADAWKPGPGAAPIPRILALLSLGVGLPYLVLSSTGPLLQSWFALARPGRSPYRLYALSNLGSLLGLLSYPFALEPALPLGGQGWLWAAGFAVFVAGCAGCAAVAGRVARVPAEWSAGEGDDPRPGLPLIAIWFALAAVASVMLLAVTNQICQEVAVVPFLWMLPLTLYLLSFILCFEYERFYRRWLWSGALVLAAAAGAAVLRWGTTPKMIPQVGLYSAVLFIYCMVCHGELVRLKPAPRHLTSFYLTVSAGGAAGGLFTALVAPAVFPAFWELHCALFAGMLLLAVLLLRDRESWLHRSRLGLVGGGTLILGALAALGFALVTQAAEAHRGALYASRNFFGTLRVLRENEGEEDEYLKLKHGRITHGLQLADPERRVAPTTYYAEDSGAGLALEHCPARERGEPIRVGVVGLGTGTLAAYARPGDSFRFYEINPDVVRLSAGREPLFTFLRDAPGRVTTVLGDARLSLEREPPERFDVFALDAFSSDAIPVHLLTCEAIMLYLRHLAPQGILAVHVSNRYLNLQPVVRGLAGRCGLKALLVDSDEDGDLVWSADWILLARDTASFASHDIRDRGVLLSVDDRGLPVWTDTYSNLLGVLKR